MSASFFAQDMPNHLAIIMDGNGRWATLRKHSRLFGHVRGARVAKTIIEECANSGLSHLTLYTFSSENWQRPQEEVSFLMNLLARYLKRERKNCIKNNIVFNCIGNTHLLPPAVLTEVEKTVEATRENSGMRLTFALSYGGRQEIVSTAKNLALQVQQGLLSPEEITEDLFTQNLASWPMPDADLIIRTSGETRLSNFLTWQSVYSEVHFTETLWPDFSFKELVQLIKTYSKTERRFGKTSEQLLNQQDLL